MFIFQKTFGQTFIKNDRFLSIVGSVSSFFNALGRLFWGFLVDKLPYKVESLFYYYYLIISKKKLIFSTDMLFNFMLNFNRFSIHHLFNEIYGLQRILFDLGVCCLLYSMWNICNHSNCCCQMFWSEKFLFDLWINVFVKRKIISFLFSFSFYYFHFIHSCPPVLSLHFSVKQ
jgi:hypothetical protein